MFAVDLGDHCYLTPVAVDKMHQFNSALSMQTFQAIPVGERNPEHDYMCLYAM
jgi:hypothetical protein